MKYYFHSYTPRSYLFLPYFSIPKTGHSWACSYQ